MKTYSIHPNSHRIDKNNFPTKDEAISRAQECAKVLNRGISVYEVEEAGTDTQKKSFPKVTSPFKHIAFVLPDGTVQKGGHPAIELLEENPEDGELETYPYAIGQLSKLVRTLDEVARHPAIPKDLKAEVFAVSDSIQDRVFDSRASVENSVAANYNTNGFVAAFKPGTVFRNASTNITVKILGFDEKSKVVSFISTADTAFATGQRPSGLQSSAQALAKVLLNGGFEVEQQEMAKQTPATDTGNFSTSPHLQPAVRTPEDDKKLIQDADEGKTLSEQLQDSAAPNEKETLLAYCMSLCRGDIYAADELAAAFLDAFNPKNTKRLTTSAHLKAMKSFCGSELPKDWFVTAQRNALRQLTAYRPSIALVPPVEVQRATASALRAAQDKGVKLPKLAKVVATRMAKGDALDLPNLEKVYLFLTGNYSKVAPLEYTAWGGDAGKNWITSVFNNFPQKA